MKAFSSWPFTRSSLWRCISCRRRLRMSRGSEVQRFRGSERRRFSPLHLWTSGPLYLFEIVAIANFLVIVWLLWPIRAPLTMLPTVVWIFATGFLLHAALGVAVRALLAWRRGQLRAYVRALGSRGWLIDTLRLAMASGLFIHAYGWIKLAVPLLHARLFDQELWNLDAKLLGGHSPNEFV